MANTKYMIRIFIKLKINYSTGDQLYISIIIYLIT